MQAENTGNTESAGAVRTAPGTPRTKAAPRSAQGAIERILMLADRLEEIPEELLDMNSWGFEKNETPKYHEGTPAPGHLGHQDEKIPLLPGATNPATQLTNSIANANLRKSQHKSRSGDETVQLTDKPRRNRHPVRAKHYLRTAPAGVKL